MDLSILITEMLPTESNFTNCSGVLTVDGVTYPYQVKMKENEVLTPARIPEALEDMLDASLEFQDESTGYSGPCVVIPRVGRLYLSLFNPNEKKIEGALVLTSSDDQPDFEICCEDGNVCCKPQGFYGTEYEDICAGLKAILEENNNALPILVQSPGGEEVS